MSRLTLCDGRVVETNDEIRRLPYDNDQDSITQSGPQWQALCKEFDLLVATGPQFAETDGDLEAQWKRMDRKAWAVYRAWEDKYITIDPVHPLKDPPGLAEARRAFEKQQIRERERFFKKARDGGRG